jgi:hypothetical protein
VAAALLEHALEPGLAPARHQISEYARSPTGAIMTVGFAAWAVSLGAMAALVPGRLAAPLALASVGVALLTIAHTETSAGRLPRGTHLDATGRLHDLGSGAASLALLVAAGMSVRALRGPRRAIVLAIVIIAVLGDLALMAVGPGVGGIRQRLLVLEACAWQGLLLLADHQSAP